MKECWRDGDLRAYLDGELSPAETARLAAHLAECHECEARYDEVAGRAGMVSGLMESLGEMEPRAAVHSPQPVHSRRRWAGAAAAIAAGIAIAAMLIPKSSRAPETPVVFEAGTVPSRPRIAGAGVAREAAIEATEAPRTVAARSTNGRSPRRRQLPRDVFLALDDEPIETGVVVRMTLGDEQIPADVVFGKDGRARAIRLIGTQTIH